jgi:hypothetical protein
MTNLNSSAESVVREVTIPVGYRIDTERRVRWMVDRGSLSPEDSLLADGMHRFEYDVVEKSIPDSIRFEAFGPHPDSLNERGIGMRYEVAKIDDGKPETAENTWLRFVFFPADEKGKEVENQSRPGFVVSVYGQEGWRPKRRGTDEPLGVEYAAVIMTDENGLPLRDDQGRMVTKELKEVQSQMVDALKVMDNKKGVE